MTKFQQLNIEDDITILWRNIKEYKLKMTNYPNGQLPFFFFFFFIECMATIKITIGRKSKWNLIVYKIQMR
jgi:uncharacterized membrane protein